MPLERYRDIVEDWERFVAVHRTPEPTTFRVRSPLSSSSLLLDRLSEQGFEIEPSPAVPGYFAVHRGPGSVAQTLEHWLGHFHIQQSVMGLPSLALAPTPGERVLDLCAAPGGKTLHLAELMKDEGPLVAVDPKEKRLRGLLGNVYRLGVSNILVIAADGRELPKGARFDRVLVDAPCSGEGNYRRQGRMPSRGRGFTRYVTSLQEALLRRAIEVTRPGGTVVYSTCTYAPEENEAVLDRVLRDAPVEIRPIPIDVPHASGLSGWDGVSFLPEMERAWRVYPHHLDSGGMFMAKLLRLSDDGSRPSADGSRPTDDSATDEDSQGWSSVPVGFPDEEIDEAEARLDAALSELEHRFGYDESWIARQGWMVRGDHVWIHGAGEWPVDRWKKVEAGRWRVVSLGLRALRSGPGGRETPASHFLTRWPSDIAPERRVALSDSQLATLLAGEALPAGELPTGPVALEWDDRVLGRGMVGRGGLRHELGKAHAERLERILA